MARKLDVSRNSPKAEEVGKTFAEKIVGQPAATQAFIDTLDKFYGGFHDPNRPIASLLFLGPTGAGKTVCVERFVEGLYGSRTNMIKVDCGEFQHSHEVAKIIGSPPGYLGHRETKPLFTNEKLASYKTYDVPFTVILFDEIEKASDALWNLLLGILDKAKLMTGTNEVVSFNDCIIAMTSNVGSGEIAQAHGEGIIGFNQSEVDLGSKALNDIAMGAARKKFTPEFLNRFDHIVMFNRLTKDDMTNIVKIELEEIRLRLIGGKTPMWLSLSPAAKRHLVDSSYSPRYGARELRRIMEREILLPLAKAVATGQIAAYESVTADYKNEQWDFWVKDAKKRKVETVFTGTESTTPTGII
jgi:ATP-dependent Clp protease ATP-binding subunit ClpA